MCGRGAISLISRPAVLGEEEFDAQHADILEALQNRAGDVDGLGRDLRGDARWGDRNIEDVLMVNVIDWHERGKGTIDAAGGDDGQLAFELDEGFENRFMATELVPGAERIVVRAEAHLSFPVVAEGRRLENSGSADFSYSVGQIGLAPNRLQRA